METAPGLYVCLSHRVTEAIAALPTSPELENNFSAIVVVHDQTRPTRLQGQLAQG